MILGGYRYVLFPNRDHTSMYTPVYPQLKVGAHLQRQGLQGSGLCSKRLVHAGLELRGQWFWL